MKLVLALTCATLATLSAHKAWDGIHTGELFALSTLFLAGGALLVKSWLDNDDI